MTNIYLYGELRNLFGPEFRYNISKPREAFTAINANRRGFLTAVKRLAAKGIFYRIVVDDQVIQDPLELEVTKAPQEIHVLPVVWGAGGNAKNIFMIVVGIALIAATGGFAALGIKGAAILTTGSLSGLGTFLGFLGAGLAMQGVMGLLFPTPKPDFNQEVSAGGKSYLFGNKPSNTSQGQAVPVGYGRLLIGSSQISATVNNYNLTYKLDSIMAPASKPIDLVPVFEGVDELEVDGYRSNQTSIFEDAVSVIDVSVSQAYVDVVTKSAKKVSSNLIELRVKKDGEIISNPNLPSYDEDLTYKWREISSSDPKKSVIQQQNSYSFGEGIVYRFSRPQEFELISNAAQSREEANYLISYPTNSLIIWGPSQFERIPKSIWNNNTRYIQNEIVTLANFFYRCKINIPSTATISTAARSAATVTITTSSNHGFASNFKAVISGLSKGNVDPNGVYAITVTNSTQFTYTLDTTDTKTEDYTVTDGKATLRTPPPIKKSYIASASRNNTIVTVVLGSSATPFNPIILSEVTGTAVEIANLTGDPVLVNPNGTYTITRVDDTTFTYDLGGAHTGTETYIVIGQDSDVLNDTQKSNVSIKTLENNFWITYRPPTTESIYRATANSEGYLPTDALKWTSEAIPADSTAFDTYLSYVNLPITQSIYSKKFENIDIAKITNNDSNIGNYTLEFLGYFYIPLNKETDVVISDPINVREIGVASATNGTVYEITKVGDVSQWSTIGVGSVPPVVGMTFTKNSTLATGNGKVAPVGQYDFKVECADQNDAFADLYINGTLVSTHNVDTAPTVTPITLTTGYHRVYARLRTGSSKNRISIYYRKNGAASYLVSGENQLLNRKIENNLVPVDEPMYTGKGNIAGSSMVTGKKYRINEAGTGNWTSIGATSSTVGTVFLKNSTAFTGTGTASESIDIAAVQADGQRLVTFSAERKDTGYSKYVSFWQCDISKGVSRYTSPIIRVGVTFLSTQNQSVVRSVPPVQALPSIF